MLDSATGEIVGLNGSIAEVSFFKDQPQRHELLRVALGQVEGQALLEVISSASKQTMYCLILSGSRLLARGQHVVATGKPLQVPVGEPILGRAFDLFGMPHDGGEVLSSEVSAPLFRESPKNLSNIQIPATVMETGIKSIDFFAPLLRGGKAAIIGGAGVGKTVILMKLAQRLVVEKTKKDRSVAVFSAVGERSREARELYETLKESGVLPQTTLILGQMGESPAVRFRTAYAGAAITEYFRDVEGRDVLYYMDNLYRFAQAGHELATITNTIPSEDGYQATLTSEMAALNERLFSTVKTSVTSLMALFVPADDFSDAGVRAAFPFLDTLIFLSRDIAQSGRYPAMDLLNSTSAALMPDMVSQDHYAAYVETKQILERAAELERIVSLVGASELSLENQQIYKRAQFIENYMTQDLYLTPQDTGHPDVSVPLARTIAVIRAILNGSLDALEPSDLWYVDEARTKAAFTKAKEAQRQSPASQTVLKSALAVSVEAP